LEFHADAIVLSGATGTKLKCEILGKYYPMWWSITSGGEGRENKLPTSILEMNAGTCEDFIEETQETILGSSGHAMELKLGGAQTSKLKVVLVEENLECFGHLKSVIHRKWNQLDVSEAEGIPEANNTGVYLLRNSLDEAISVIEKISSGNSLFFFDQLLYTSWTEIERVAKKRIRFYYQTRTEFIIFLFTSDWFVGRSKLGLVPLPQESGETSWTENERQSVSKMDDLFGMNSWRESILTGESTDLRIGKLVEAYKDRLHRWFRYVVPMPFKPKRDQLYHLFMCSNYETGITLTKRFYAKFAENDSYSPDNQAAYSMFKRLHAAAVAGYSGNQRPVVWKMLWAVIRNHEEGLCDIRCDDLRAIDESWQSRLGALQWLHITGYLTKGDPLTDAWDDKVPMYKLDWKVVQKNLGIQPPKALVPMEP
jgi:three-Cys-motif partner protein